MIESRPTVSEVIDLLQSFVALQAPVDFDEEKQALTFVDQDSSTYVLTFPLIFPKLSSGTAEDMLWQISNLTQTYTVILIQAGVAALGYYVDGELVEHKVIRKYMVRKKQGKSQIKHLKSKGKSRLGSRIRLRNSILFFEELNETLTKWDISSNSESILAAVPINLKNLLFTSNVPPPFEKKDLRIKKIPLDIKVPSFKELVHVNWIVSRGIVSRGIVSRGTLNRV